MIEHLYRLRKSIRGVVFLEGPSGSGKTYLLKNLQINHSNTYIQNRKMEPEFKEFSKIASIRYISCSNIIPESVKLGSELSFSILISYIHGMCDELDPNFPTYLILDNIEIFSINLVDKIFNKKFSNAFPAYLKLIISRISNQKIPKNIVDYFKPGLTQRVVQIKSPSHIEFSPIFDQMESQLREIVDKVIQSTKNSSLNLHQFPLYENLE